MRDGENLIQNLYRPFGQRTVGLNSLIRRGLYVQHRSIEDRRCSLRRNKFRRHILELTYKSSDVWLIFCARMGLPKGLPCLMENVSGNREWGSSHSVVQYAQTVRERSTTNHSVSAEREALERSR